MKITNHGISNVAMTTQPEVTASTDAPRESAAATPTSSADAYSPSQEWVRMLDLVKQQPEVRADRVQQVMARLARGDYATAESIAKTADAILSSMD